MMRLIPLGRLTLKCGSATAKSSITWDGGLRPGDVAPRIAFLQRSYPKLEDDGITWTVSSLPWRQISYDKPTNDDLKNTLPADEVLEHQGRDRFDPRRGH